MIYLVSRVPSGTRLILLLSLFFGVDMTTMLPAGSHLERTSKLRWLGNHLDFNQRFGIVHYCAGCDMDHIVYVEQQQGASKHPTWKWNGEFNEKITCTPSVHVQYGARFNPDLHLGTLKRDEDDVVQMTCHYFITNGKIAYCGDCTHKLAGKTVELPDFPAD